MINGVLCDDKLADCLVIRSRKHDIEEDILQDVANASGSDSVLYGKVCHMFDCIRREFQQDVILAKQAGVRAVQGSCHSSSEVPVRALG